MREAIMRSSQAIERIVGIFESLVCRRTAA
jgi:hypothetical protein